VGFSHQAQTPYLIGLFTEPAELLITLKSLLTNFQVADIQRNVFRAVSAQGKYFHFVDELVDELPRLTD
jgi:hypothetical protein